jgi:hypothetical protein
MLDAGKDSLLLLMLMMDDVRSELKHQLCARFRTSVLGQKENACLAFLRCGSITEPCG